MTTAQIFTELEKLTYQIVKDFDDVVVSEQFENIEPPKEKILVLRTPNFGLTQKAELSKIGASLVTGVYVVALSVPEIDKVPRMIELMELYHDAFVEMDIDGVTVAEVNKTNVGELPNGRLSYSVSVTFQYWYCPQIT